MKELLKKHFLKYSTEEKFNYYWKTPSDRFWNTSVEKWIEILKKYDFTKEDILKMLKKDIDQIFIGEIMGA